MKRLTAKHWGYNPQKVSHPEFISGSHMQGKQYAIGNSACGMLKQVQHDNLYRLIKALHLI
jgi:hypothetical protein